ncbi:VTC domain-containing protein [Streptomyces sp. NPDC003077]|uniref:VTC domain-containing protein n=1 Tax=Streptomyces sp. NPDC003077 TaxID=3154443 RepID=UPI0033A42AA3
MIPAVRALSRAAMAARPVPLSDPRLHAARHSRSDAGYLVPVEVFREFAERLTDPRRKGGAPAVLCVNGRRWPRARSVYYDTCDLRFFHDGADVGGGRLAVRERSYEDTGARQLEIKVRRPGGTVVERLPLAPGATALDDGPRDALTAALRAHGGQESAPALRPTLEAERQRVTFVAEGQRVTCDAGITCRDPETGEAVRSDGGLVLVRVRSGQEADGSTGPPSDAHGLLREHGLRPAAFGTYRMGLGALRPGLLAADAPERPALRAVFPRAVAGV